MFLVIYLNKRDSFSWNRSSGEADFCWKSPAKRRASCWTRLFHVTPAQLLTFRGENGGFLEISLIRGVPQGLNIGRLRREPQLKDEWWPQATFWGNVAGQLWPAICFSSQRFMLFLWPRMESVPFSFSRRDVIQHTLAFPATRPILRQSGGY